MKEQANGFVKVRINQYPEDHVDAYAHVEWVDWNHRIVCVSNMNMPFMGTFGHEQFRMEDVEFVR